MNATRFCEAERGLTFQAMSKCTCCPVLTLLWNPFVWSALRALKSLLRSIFYIYGQGNHCLRHLSRRFIEEKSRFRRERESRESKHRKRKKTLVDMGRPPCCDKVGVKKGPWTPEEDIILVSYIQEHGPGNWRAVPTNTG